MRAKIDEIAEKAKAEGADFAALADELSDDKAREGGYLGFVGGSFDEAVYGQAFVKRAMELTEDNPIAGPVQSPIGMHVLKFQSRKESETLPYASVQALAKEAATTKLINEELERRQKALAEAADTTTTFEGLAEQLGTEKFARKTTVFKNVDHMLIDLDVGSLARDKEFIETLEVGELSEVLTGAGGSLCLVVDEFQESHLPEMDETREAVIRDFTHDRALELAEADALEGVEMVKAEEGGLDAWAEQKGLEIVTTEFFERRSSPKELSETIDNLSNLTYKTPIGAIRMAALSLGGEQTGWIVWRIKDIDKPSTEQWEKDRAMFQQQLLLMKQWTLFEEWLADARQAWQVELANQEG
jgi:peptidyl-prolyl cis-trans isomerase D